MFLALSFWSQKPSGYALVQLPCDEIQWGLLFESVRFIVLFLLLLLLF